MEIQKCNRSGFKKYIQCAYLLVLPKEELSDLENRSMEIVGSE